MSAIVHAGALATLSAWPGAWSELLAAVAFNHAVLAAFGCWPRSTLLGANRTRLPEASALRREVALTFDDGPDPLVTPLVLDLLDEAGATASFFCIGRRAAAFPSLVAEIARRGHAVENHTQSHSNLFACLGIGGLQREIGMAQETLAALTGRAPRHFRSPMGLRSPLLDMALSGSGLEAVAWTRRGYDTIRRNPARVSASLTRNLDAGDILLLHDGNGATTVDGVPVALAVLPGLLAELKHRELRAVSLDRALGAELPAQGLSPLVAIA